MAITWGGFACLGKRQEGGSGRMFWAVNRRAKERRQVSPHVRNGRWRRLAKEAGTLHKHRCEYLNSYIDKVMNMNM
jgi:hypothetical protein